MNRRRSLVAAAVLALVGIGVWFGMRPDAREREVRAVQRRLLDLAKAVSFEEKDPPFVRLGYGERVTGYFADPMSYEISLGSRRGQGTFPRGELRDALMGMRTASRGLSVTFLDIAVDLAPDFTQATVHLTSKIYFTGEPDYWVQEFRFRLVRPNGDWLVASLETLRTMEQ